MSQKLSNSTRDTIINKLMLHVFQTKIEDMQKRHAAFAVSVYEDVFTQKERELMDSLPNGWLRTDNDIQVSFGYNHRYARLSFNGSDFRPDNIKMVYPSQILKRFPQKDGCMKAYDAKDAICKEYESLDEESKALLSEINTKYSKAKGAIYSCSTTGVLLKAWPEIEPFIPEFALLPVEKYQVALRTEKLNAEFGLPVPDVAA